MVGEKKKSQKHKSWLENTKDKFTTKVKKNNNKKDKT